MAHGPEFRIVTQGVREVQYMFKGIGRRAEDCRPVMEDIYRDALDVIDANFETESARGEPWMPLTFTTKIWRARMGYHGGILQATGELRHSMTTAHHPLQYSRVERFKVVISSRTIKGRAHQHGYRQAIHGFLGIAQAVTTPTMQNVPARRYVAFTEIDRKRYARKILFWITRGTLT